MTTALFLGRFQPPHVGHLITIRHLGARYDHVIVGVTESEPSVMPVPRVLELMRLLLPDDSFSFIHVRGSVEEGTAVVDCDFDVCCSGNPPVLDRMAERGYRTEFVQRSSDAIYSGTRERADYIENAIAHASEVTSLKLYEFKITETKLLRPIEKINPRHYTEIERDILACGVMNKPLIVDRSSMAVLDGSHRYALLVKHGFRLAPVILCDYDDESVFVGNHLGHRFEHDDRRWISKRHVRATAITGKLYEPRTTRHFFPFRKIDIPTQLDRLAPAGITSIDHLIAQVTPEKELASNEGYINELDQELRILEDYRREQSEVLNWLKRQNELIRESTSKTDDSATNGINK